MFDCCFEDISFGSDRTYAKRELSAGSNLRREGVLGSFGKYLYRNGQFALSEKFRIIIVPHWWGTIMILNFPAKDLIDF